MAIYRGGLRSRTLLKRISISFGGNRLGLWLSSIAPHTEEKEGSMNVFLQIAESNRSSIVKSEYHKETCYVWYCHLRWQEEKRNRHTNSRRIEKWKP